MKGEKLFQLLFPAVLCQISCNLMRTIRLFTTRRQVGLQTFTKKGRQNISRENPATNRTQRIRPFFSVLVEVPAALTKTTLQEI